MISLMVSSKDIKDQLNPEAYGGALAFAGTPQENVRFTMLQGQVLEM